MLKYKKILALTSISVTLAPMVAVVSCSMTPDGMDSGNHSSSAFYVNGDSNGNQEKRTHLSWLHDGDSFYFDEFESSPDHTELFKSLKWPQVPNEIRLFGVDTPEIDLNEDGINGATTGNEWLYAVKAKIFVLNELFGSYDVLKYMSDEDNVIAINRWKDSNLPSSLTKYYNNLETDITSQLEADTFKPFDTSVQFRNWRGSGGSTYNKDIDSTKTSVTAVKTDTYNRMVANVKYIPYSVSRLPDSQLLPEYVGKKYPIDITLSAQNLWEDMGVSLLRHGLARVAYIDKTYTDGLNTSITHTYVDKLISVQNKAIHDHVGIWSLPKDNWFGKGNVFPKGTHAITTNPNY